MKWSAPIGGGDFQKPDPGTYLARCVRLIDLGTQEGEYQGKPTSKRQVMIGWELPTELIPNGDFAGQPYLMTKFYTQSLHEKAKLRHDLINWRGRDFTEEELEGFEAKNILGVPCLITLTESENGRVNVTGVTAPPKGTKVPKQINESVFFSLEPDEYDSTVFEGLSEGIKKIIEKSPEYQRRNDGPGDDYIHDVGDFDDESIPF